MTLLRPPNGDRAGGTYAFVALAAVLFTGRATGAVDWPLTDTQLERLERGEVLVTADVDRAEARGDVRAAVRITAPPDEIFAAMTDCEAALRFVPRLEKCTVLETAADGLSQVIEHIVDYGWYAPAAHYVFRAEYEPARSIAFHHVRGDFRENHGHWELVPLEGGATIVTYRVRIVTRFYVPQWLIRSSLRRELPNLLEALRTWCERHNGRQLPGAGITS